jgi:DNA-binding PadR family transcriptional regulator
MSELARRSGGLWRPSPGSIYPVLQQLQDEGLVTVAEDGGRRVFSLTGAGQEYVHDHAAEIGTPWVQGDQETADRVSSLQEAFDALGTAVRQVAQLADPEQAARARRTLDQARRTMYVILSEEAPADGTPAVAGPSSRENDGTGTGPGPGTGDDDAPSGPSV